MIPENIEANSTTGPDPMEEVQPGPNHYQDSREGWHPPPQRPRERSPCYTYNHYAALRDLRDTNRDDWRDYEHRYEQGHNQSFLDRGREHHPPKKTEEPRKRSPIRKEDAEGERENRRGELWEKGFLISLKYH